MKPIFILNGPNLNLLGTREPDLYGHDTLTDIENRLVDHGKRAGIAISFRQSNHEGVLIDWIHEARLDADALIMNAGAYTHTSIAIMDALKTLKIPIVEVHLSNVFKRETYRHHSYISPAATGVICGFGIHSYDLALFAALAAIDADHSKLTLQTALPARNADV